MLSAVIPLHDQAEDPVPPCEDGTDALPSPKHLLAIVFVDGGSGDRSAEIRRDRGDGWSVSCER